MGKSIDITGKRFGKLLAKTRCGVDKHGFVLWEVVCDCGVKKTVSASRLVNGDTKSCGCSRQDNLVGQCFGRLTVLSRADSKNGDMRWLCKCTCGNQTVAFGNALKRGQTKSCKCLRKENWRFAVDSIRLPLGEASKNVVIKNYKNGARAKKAAWGLTDEEFFHIISNNCHYCGQPPSNCTNRPENNGDFIYNGIDRLKNDVGYVPGNVVPSCWKCNWMKRHLSQEDFLNHIEQIHTFQLAKPEIGEMQHV